MQGLKKFYKYYGTIIGLLSLWFLFRDLGSIIPFLFLLTLPFLSMAHLYISQADSMLDLLNTIHNHSKTNKNQRIQALLGFSML